MKRRQFISLVGGAVASKDDVRELRAHARKHQVLVAETTPIVLPWPLQSSLEAMARVLLEPGDRSHIDFSRPVGEAALLSPESVSWRVFKNPLSLLAASQR